MWHMNRVKTNAIIGVSVTLFVCCWKYFDKYLQSVYLSTINLYENNCFMVSYQRHRFTYH